MANIKKTRGEQREVTIDQKLEALSFNGNHY